MPYTQVLCQYRLYRADHAYLTHLMLQWQLSHLNGRKLTTAKFKPLIFYTANMFILMILYDFCVSSAQFCYITVYTSIWKVGSCVQIADRCALRKISNGAPNLVLRNWELFWDPRYVASGQTQQKTSFPNNPSIVAWVFAAAGMCIPSLYLAMNEYSV
jgi:hypothetical protein